MTKKNNKVSKYLTPFQKSGVFYLKMFYYICIMENRSTHYGDVAKWIEKVIDSCEMYKQTFGAKMLVRNFEKQLRRNHPEKYWREHYYNIISPLEHELANKRQQLIKKQLES